MDPSALLLILLKGAFEGASFLIDKAKKNETVTEEEWNALAPTIPFDQLVPKKPE